MRVCTISYCVCVCVVGIEKTFREHLQRIREHLQSSQSAGSHSHTHSVLGGLVNTSSRVSVCVSSDSAQCR